MCNVLFHCGMESLFRKKQHFIFFNVFLIIVNNECKSKRPTGTHGFTDYLCFDINNYFLISNLILQNQFGVHFRSLFISCSF